MPREWYPFKHGSPGKFLIFDVLAPTLTRLFSDIGYSPLKSSEYQKLHDGWVYNIEKFEVLVRIWNIKQSKIIMKK